MFSKKDQLGKKKPNRTQINQMANNRLRQLKIDKDIRHCELCPIIPTTNAHRHKRDWYKGKPDGLLWNYNQVLFLCQQCHSDLDDRSKTTEEEKERVFITLRGQ